MYMFYLMGVFDGWFGFLEVLVEMPLGLIFL